MRFNIRPGERMSEALDEPGTTLFHDGIPDWVTIPEELGGGRFDVKTHGRQTCVCGEEHESLVLTLDEPSGLEVAECMVRRQFIWFRRRA